MSERLNRLLLAIVPYHRMLLVAATIGISLTASRLANDHEEVASWLLLVAAGALLPVADYASALDREAARLAGAARTSRSSSMRDLHDARWPAFALSAALVAAVGGASFAAVTFLHSR